MDSFALSTSQAGDFDAFIAKFDGAGNLNWARQLGGFGEESGIDLKVDKAGAVYSNGIFRTIIDLDPDPVITYNLGDLSGISNYVSKLDAAGHFIWAKKIGKNAGLLSLGIDPPVVFIWEEPFMRMGILIPVSTPLF